MKNIKPYEFCASRLEQRGSHPPTRAYVDQLVKGVEATGVEALIHSAVSPAGQALFPSKVFPHCHPRAAFAPFRYLLDRLHEIGRPVLSWYALNISSSVITQHPDWRMIPMVGEGLPTRTIQTGVKDDYFCCINSPYRQLLPPFCQEIVRDVGFDGVWFDGSTFALEANGLAGCRCHFCRAKFKKDTGERLPDAVDWESIVFRRWVNWRYECLVSFWHELQAAILEVNPRALVAFNNYRRRRANGGWETGIPLRKFGWDVLMSGELDLHVFHGDFQMKMHRAYGCKRGQDTWMALCDHWNMWVPDVERVPIQQAAVSCASAGGVMWMGSGTDPGLVPATCATAQETTGPLMPYLEGEPLDYAAIWVSQQTQDFYWQARGTEGWDESHGANELCLQAHVPSAIIFDEHVTEGDMVGRYPVLLAGEAACVSTAQARQLERYVRSGGTLIATAQAGCYDELGRPRRKPVLDALLGIRGRSKSTGTATLEIKNPVWRDRIGSGYVSIQQEHVLARPVAGVERIADVVDHGQVGWDNIENGTKPLPRQPGAWQRRVGKGTVIYLGAPLFRDHIQHPTVFKVGLFKALLFNAAPPPVELQAPLQVSLNIRARADGAWMIHLHNAPGTVWRYSTRMNSGEILPVYGLCLKFRDRRITRAYSGLNGQPYEVADAGATVRIPALYRNEVVIVC